MPFALHRTCGSQKSREGRLRRDGEIVEVGDVLTADYDRPCSTRIHDVKSTGGVASAAGDAGSRAGCDVAGAAADTGDTAACGVTHAAADAGRPEAACGVMTPAADASRRPACDVTITPADAGEVPVKAGLKESICSLTKAVAATGSNPTVTYTMS